MSYDSSVIVANKNSLSVAIGYQDIYIGRPSLLGNPFKLSNENENEREEVIYKYSEYLNKSAAVCREINRLIDIVKSGQKIRLICFCYPKACHGDVIRNLILTKLQSKTQRVLSATGHRPNKLGGYDNESRLLLVKFAEETLRKYQPSKVISGMALGWDIAIASAAVNLGIPFIASVPFADQWKRWTNEDVKLYKQLLLKASEIVMVDELENYQVPHTIQGKYHVAKMQQRNEWMVDNSEGILALWNASDPKESIGGTKNCVDYAKTRYDFPKEQLIYLWESWVEFRSGNLGNHDDEGKQNQEQVIKRPEVIEITEKPEPDILVVDVVAEIYGESTANYLSREPEETSGYGNTLQEIGDALADEILGLSNSEPGEIIYPHQRNPELPFSPYNAVFNTGKFIHVDEEYLAANLHWKPDFDFTQCEWEPKRVPDYREAKRVYLDIETLGLDGTDPDCRCIMIGVMIEGAFKIPEKVFDKLSKGFIIELEDDKFDFEDDAERNMMTGLFRLIEMLKPDAIVTHNGFNFDFTFLIQRCEYLGIDHPMTRLTDKERVITAASMNGQPIRYYPVYWTKPNGWGKVWNDGSFPQLVDTMHLAGQHDKIFANMTGYGLKYLGHYVGFREEKRLELTYKEIHEYWISGDNEKRQLIRDYLLFDLEDQRAVTNFFMVSPWYQQMYFPLPLQEICVASPARKHNANLDKFYKKYYGKQITLPDGNRKYYQKPEADEKVGYEGALVDCKPGVYKYFFSIDVASLYPSLTLMAVLMSQSKDPLGVFLKTIWTLRSLRYVYKDLGGDNPENVITRQAYKDFPYLFNNIDLTGISKEDKKIFKGVDNSLKVGINGGYGFEGVGFYNFNDIESAALITAYGRIMITRIRNIIESFSELIQIDTDGAKSSPKLIKDVDSELLTATYYYPEGFKKNKIDVSGQIIAIDDGNGFVNPEWIWQAAQSQLPEGIVIELEQNCPNGAVYAPAMKNYIFWESPEKAPKLKGVYRKRNRSELQKEFPIEFIRLWAFEGEGLAHKFGNDWISKLSGFKVTNKNILRSHTIIDPKTKKLPTEEKRLNKLLIESGCGEIGETISYYWASKQRIGSKGKKGKPQLFPIRRYADGRCPDSTFPEDVGHVNKAPNVLYYVEQLETKVIPYSEKDNLETLIDKELLRKLLFTQRIAKRTRNKNGDECDSMMIDSGMGDVGDVVSYYWASIGSISPTGKLSAKCDRFPVRVIINEDDSLTIDLQEIPHDVDKSLLNLNFNVEWYLEDLMKIKNEILDVVGNQKTRNRV